MTSADTIIFATTNKGKIASLRNALDKAGLASLKIDPRVLDIIEPQADSCEEVAVSKARQAFALVGQPVLVDDSSFHIACLGGFPGVYAKYMNETLGAEGVVDFMRGKRDRSAHFEGVLVYIDSSGQEYTFFEEPYRGVITEEVYDIKDAAPWSVLHKIFIPKGSTSVLGNMTEEDRQRVKAGQDSPSKYGLFVDWIQQTS